jgi:cytidine deaminase
VAVESLAVTAAVDANICEEPTYPCGACRQVLAESEKRFAKESESLQEERRLFRLLMESAVYCHLLLTIYQDSFS